MILDVQPANRQGIHGPVVGGVLSDLDAVFGDVVESHILNQVRRPEDVQDVEPLLVVAIRRR